MLDAPANVESSCLVDWIREAQRGDPCAFEDLFRRFESPLRRAIARRISPELAHHLDPDDVVQETFLAAYLAIDRYEVRGDASFFAWLVRIAMRKLRDAIRFHRREKRTPQAMYFDASPDPDSGRRAPAGEVGPCDEDLLERLGERELGQIVVRCLERLSPELREVVVLRECAEVPWQRVAQLVGRRTIGGVRHLHLQACAELARLVTLSVGGRVGLGLS